MEQQEGIHPRILERIRRLQQGDVVVGGESRRSRPQDQEHLLYIDGAEDVNLHSVQYLVDFLSGDTHQITELVIVGFSLARPSDGGLNILCDFFTNQTTLTRVRLDWCNFGSVEEASRLIVALQTNSSVTDLTIRGIENLNGVVLGNCISGLLQNNPRLQRLQLGYIDAEIARSLQPGLQTNRHLKILDISFCGMEDEGLHLIVDALVGNTTMELLDISSNLITSNGLVDITRLAESTRLKKVGLGFYSVLFSDINVVQHFTNVLHQHTSLEELPRLDLDRFPVIKNILARNTSIRHANELLALQPRTGLPIGSKSGIWYMAMAQMGRDNNNNSGASAIFHILQKRPALLEKQLRRPPPLAQEPSQQQVVSRRRGIETASGAGVRKQARLAK